MTNVSNPNYDGEALANCSSFAKNLQNGKNLGHLNINTMNLGNKFRLSGIGDGVANDRWLRLFHPNNKNYHGGFAAGELYSNTNISAVGNVTATKNVNATNVNATNVCCGGKCINKASIEKINFWLMNDNLIKSLLTPVFMYQHDWHGRLTTFIRGDYDQKEIRIRGMEDRTTTIFTGSFKVKVWQHNWSGKATLIQPNTQWIAHTDGMNDNISSIKVRYPWENL